MKPASYSVRKPAQFSISLFIAWLEKDNENKKKKQIGRKQYTQNTWSKIHPQWVLLRKVSTTIKQEEEEYYK